MKKCALRPPAGALTAFILLALAAAAVHARPPRVVDSQTQMLHMRVLLGGNSSLALSAALFTVVLDQPLYVKRAASGSDSSGGHAGGSQGEHRLEAVEVTALPETEGLLGLLALRCGRSHFHSHPPSAHVLSGHAHARHISADELRQADVNALLPRWLLPLPALRSQPVHSLLSAWRLRERGGAQDANVVSALLFTSWQRDGQPAVENLAADLLHSCRLSFPPRAKQLWFPRGQLGNMRGAPLSASVDMPAARNGSSGDCDCHRATVVLTAPRQLHDEASKRGSLSVHTLTHAGAAAEHIPTCKPKIASDSQAGIVMSDGSYLSALEVEDLVVHQMPGLSEIIDPVAEGMTKPVVEQMMAMTGNMLTDKLNNDLAQQSGAEVPADVARMVTKAVTYNLTNLLTDSVTHAVGKALVQEMKDQMADYAFHEVNDRLLAHLAHELRHLLTDSLVYKIDSTLPELVQRNLQLQLAHSLTRSVTHAVVPTLSKALTHNEQQAYWCHQCFYHNKWCNYCHYSVQASYYDSYYSTYYSDYYSDYYADYYVEALHQLDRLQHDVTARYQALRKAGGGR